MKKRKPPKQKKQYRKTRKTSHRLSLIRECDKIWSELIHKRDVVCQWPGCGKPGQNAHHIFSRKHLGTRWCLCNGLCLCWAHHLHLAHGEPELFRDFIIKRLGEVRFNEIKALAYTPQKVDVQYVLIGLKLLLGRTVGEVRAV